MEEINSITLALTALRKVEELAPLEELKELRKKMLMLGFKNPFSTLPKITVKEKESKKEAEERKKQLEYLINKALLKRSALVKTNIAIKSRIYKETLKHINMAEMTEFLPLRGELINVILYGGEITLLTYKKFYKILKEAKLFKSSMSAKILSSTTTAFAYEQALSYLYNNLKDYNKTLEKMGLTPFSNLEEVEGFEQQKKMLSSLGFGTYEEGTFKLNKHIKSKLEENIKKLKELTESLSNFAIKQIFARTFTYYSKRELKRMKPLPNLNTEGNLSYILEKEIVEVIKEKERLNLNKNETASLLASKIGKEKTEALLGIKVVDSIDKQGEEFLKKL